MDESNRADSPRLDGRVALVTGAGSGIGRAAALAFARAGARVVLAGRRAPELDEVAGLIAAAGGEALSLPTDVSREAEVRALVEGAVARFGRLDCAFNNAGTEGGGQPAHETDEAEFDRVIGINLKGVWLCMKHEIRAMIEAGNGGAIVNTSSFLAVGTAPGMAVYGASKGGLDAMIRGVAVEVGGQGIRVNNIQPGVIDTPMFRRGANDEVAGALSVRTPLQRLGQANDIGDVAVFLCSDGARFVTGQSLLVDGGFTIGGPR